MGLAAGIDLLACPRCGEPLRLERSAGCRNGHSFDVARQGYLNLHDRAAPRNADTADMIAARVDLLGAGHYDLIADAVARLLPDPARTLLDAGAGTGYYAARLLTAREQLRAVAVDVSVPAVRRAARAHPRLAAVVGDVWQQLPVRSGVFDVVLSVFAPRNPAEFARSLGRPGWLITVTPSPVHLQELRTALGLLDHQPDKADRLARSLAPWFRSEDSELIRSDQHWAAATARNAVLMGPNAFHLTRAELDERIDRLGWPRPVTVAARVDRFALR